MKLAGPNPEKPEENAGFRRGEMNEALVPVLGFSQTLLRNPEVSEPLRREFLLRIAGGARRLLELVNQSKPK